MSLIFCYLHNCNIIVMFSLAVVSELKYFKNLYNNSILGYTISL